MELQQTILPPSLSRQLASITWSRCRFAQVTFTFFAFKYFLLFFMDFQLFADKVCKRPWNFERVPNKNIEGHDKALIFTSTKEACLAACLNEVTFIFILHHPPPHLYCHQHLSSETPNWSFFPFIIKMSN